MEDNNYDFTFNDYHSFLDNGKKKNIVKSIRGSNGGYLLSKNANHLKLSEIFCLLYLVIIILFGDINFFEAAFEKNPSCNALLQEFVPKNYKVKPPIFSNSEINLPEELKNELNVQYSNICYIKLI